MIATCVEAQFNTVSRQTCFPQPSRLTLLDSKHVLTMSCSAGIGKHALASNVGPRFFRLDDFVKAFPSLCYSLGQKADFRKVQTSDLEPSQNSKPDVAFHAGAEFKT